MKRAVLVVLLAIAAVGTGQAEPLPEAYFAATPPGSWARYETSTSDGGKNVATYTRLADHDGGMVLEIATEFTAGPAAGAKSTSLFTLAPDFDWRRRFPSFGKSLTGTTFLMEGRPPMVQAEPMVEAMREAMSDFGDGFSAKGKGSHAGVGCDRFVYHATSGGPNAGTMDGEICLSASIPFGVVHQTATSRGAKSGESSFETRLLDSGTGPARAAPAVALGGTPATKAPAAPPGAVRPVNLALAYQLGLVALHFRVFPGSEGRAFEVTLENVGDQPLTVATGTSTYAFEVGPPIGTLYFSPVYDEAISIAPGQRADRFQAGQPTGRGVRDGSFRLQNVRGVPTFSGEVSVGSIGE